MVLNEKSKSYVFMLSIIWLCWFDVECPLVHVGFVLFEFGVFLDCAVKYIQRITRAIEMGRATRTSSYLSLSRAHCLISDS